MLQSLNSTDLYLGICTGPAFNSVPPLIPCIQVDSTILSIRSVADHSSVNVTLNIWATQEVEPGLGRDDPSQLLHDSLFLWPAFPSSYHCSPYSAALWVMNRKSYGCSTSSFSEMKDDFVFLCFLLLTLPLVSILRLRWGLLDVCGKIYKKCDDYIN